MKKAWMLVSALLTLLTLAGAGYACVPMTLASCSLSRKSK